MSSHLNPQTKRHYNKDSISGKFVDDDFVAAHPDTTYTIAVPEKTVVRMLNEYRAMVDAQHMYFPEWPDNLTMADAMEKGYITFNPSPESAPKKP